MENELLSMMENDVSHSPNSPSLDLQLGERMREGIKLMNVDTNTRQIECQNTNQNKCTSTRQQYFTGTRCTLF